MPIDDTKIVISVSVGKADFEGSCLRKILLHARKAKEVYIEICDSLQRHNLESEEGLTSEEALARAIKAGDEWWERNKGTITEILGDKLKEVRSWENWRLSPDYPRERTAFDRLCNRSLVIEELLRSYAVESEDSFIPRFSDPNSFEQAMFCSIKSHLKNRQLPEKPLEEHRKAIESCYEYLAEETVIIYKLWQGTGYSFILYPGKITDILEKGYNEFVSRYPNLLQWECVSVRDARKLKKSSTGEDRAVTASASASFFGTRLRPPEISEVLRRSYSLFVYLGELDARSSNTGQAARFFLIQALILPATQVLLKGIPSDDTSGGDAPSHLDSPPHTPRAIM